MRFIELRLRPGFDRTGQVGVAGRDRSRQRERRDLTFAQARRALRGEDAAEIELQVTGVVRQLIANRIEA